MSKEGLKACVGGNILADLAAKEGWTLCVGAGISRPAFPSWPDLVKRLLEKDLGGPKTTVLGPTLLGAYSPDAIIQAAKDRLGATDEVFRDCLAGLLYQDLQGMMTGPDFQTFADVLAAERPAQLTIGKWTRFLELARTHLSGSTSLDLAQVLYEIAGTAVAPRGVLSFNAEPLLFALTNALKVEEFYKKGASLPTEGDRAQLFDFVTRSISRKRTGRIPYVFLHGLLPVPDPSGVAHRAESSDKLVFSEASYLQLANTSFSWQSALFLDAASSNHLVFVGVSLSDPNMRRWLAWAHENRLRELDAFGPHDSDSTSHYWIHKRPTDDSHCRWLESLVAHLGVRLVWLDDWAQAGHALRHLLAL